MPPIDAQILPAAKLLAATLFFFRKLHRLRDRARFHA
jgi:hypothetical protein